MGGTTRATVGVGAPGRWRQRWLIAGAVLLLVAASTTAPALGQEPDPVAPAPAVDGLTGVELEPGASGRPAAPQAVAAAADADRGKVATDVLAAANGAASPNELGLASSIIVRDGRPDVEITVDDLTPAVERQIRATGFEPTGVFPQFDLVTGSADGAQLAALAAIDTVVHIRGNHGAEKAVGSVTSQADQSIGAAAARAAVGVDGSGVEIGVMSDSFNSLSAGSTSGTACNRTTSGTASQTSNDLPATVGNLAPDPGSFSDEGRGMMELIHDLAPGADLTFRTAFVSEADFAVGIGDLVDCGADVVVDDIIYFSEPMFQDGLVAKAAQDAFDAGVPYFSSAGNFARFGIDQTFRDSAPADDVNFGDDLHDFDPGPAINNLMPLVVPAGAGGRLLLQWNQPFVTGGIGPGAAVDLDLVLCFDPTCSPGNILVFGNQQGCSPGARAGDPLEGVVFTPQPTNTTIWIGVDHVCGSQSDTRFRIVIPGADASWGYGTTTSGAPVFNAAQTWGHSAAAGAMSVAAVLYDEIDQGGVYPPGPEINVEPFSSLGGDLPFYFDANGSPLPGAPVTRFKPDIAAPDGTNTTFFGSSDFEGDGFPNFFGTSAAAPHAAAVAALMLEGQPTLRPDQVYDRLKDTALDIETPGVDPLAGHGLVQALSAVPPAFDLTVLPQPCSVYDSDTAGGSLGGPIPANGTRTIRVAGTLPGNQGVPVTTCVPTGATGVLYTISATDAQGVGNLRLSESGVVANGGVVNYIDNGLNNANTVAVPLGASGDVDVFANNSATGVRLVVVGYYSSSGTLTYNGVTPCAFADSRSNQGPSGAFVGPFGPGAAYPDVDVVGNFSSAQGGGNTNCGIPAGADAIVANLVAVGADGGAGFLAAGTGGSTATEPVTYFADLPINNATTVVVPLTAAGTMAVDIGSLSGSPTVNVRLVALGYLSDEVGDDYNELNPCAFFDTRNGQGASGGFLGLRGSGNGGVTTYQVTGSGLANQGGGNGGTCGVPAGASAVLVNLVAITPNIVGNFRAYATGSTPTGGVLNFAPLTPAMNNSNAVVVPLSAAGQMDLFVNTPNNDGSPSTHARGVILGYYR